MGQGARTENRTYLMIPYATQTIEEVDLAAVRSVLTSGWLTQGPAVPRFEKAFAAVHQVQHACAVTNATAGLHLACLALDVGPGDWVWTSPNSFVASANCALYCGARVDFVDIDLVTRNMCVLTLAEKLVQAKKQGMLPKVVIPVHFAGLPCDMKALRTLADEYGFALIGDASHAVGSSYMGKPVASDWADISVFSFHPVKIITTGEGGMVVTNKPHLARRLLLLRSHGITRDEDLMETVPEGPWVYEQHDLGFNYRMTDMQAALGCSQLDRLSVFHEQRESIAARYPQMLSDLGLKLPVVANGYRSSWHLYVVEVTADRARILTSLREQDIWLNVHYIPIYLQPYHRRLGGFKPGYCPNAEAYYQGALSLPIYPTLTLEQQQLTADALRSAITA